MWKLVLVAACAAIVHSASIISDSAPRDKRNAQSDVPQCPQNQQYSNCSNALCRAQKCEEKGISIPCPGVSQCETSCVCVDGFLRNSKGVCVEQDQCDVGPSCPENQVYSNCTNAICRHEYCFMRSQPISCPEVSWCNKGCVCDTGYLRNANGNCVKEDQCD